MGRVKTAVDGKDYDLAIKLLNAVIDIKPDFVEAWNRRATIYLLEEGFRPARSPTSARCWRVSRAISARSPGSASFCRSSATTSARSMPSAARSPFIPSWSAFPIWPRSWTDKIDGRGI